MDLTVDGTRISYSGQSDDKHRCFLSEYSHSFDAEGRWGFRVTEFEWARAAAVLIVQC